MDVTRTNFLILADRNHRLWWLNIGGNRQERECQKENGKNRSALVHNLIIAKIARNISINRKMVLEIR